MVGFVSYCQKDIVRVGVCQIVGCYRFYVWNSLDGIDCYVGQIGEVVCVGVIDFNFQNIGVLCFYDCVGGSFYGVGIGCGEGVFDV